MKYLFALLPLAVLIGCGGDSQEDRSGPVAAGEDVHLEAPERVAAPAPELLIDRARL